MGVGNSQLSRAKQLGLEVNVSQQKDPGKQMKRSCPRRVGLMLLPDLPPRDSLCQDPSWGWGLKVRASRWPAGGKGGAADWQALRKFICY